VEFGKGLSESFLVGGHYIDEMDDLSVGQYYMRE